MATAETDNLVITSLKAQLAALEGRQEHAIQTLEGKDDPESIFRMLTILIEAERFEDAVRVVSGRKPNDRWCEKATLAFASSGKSSEAAELVEWARLQDNLNLWQASVVALSRGRFTYVMKGKGDGELFLPGELNPEQEDGVKAALSDLTPVIAMVKAVKLVRNGIEAAAISLAMEYTYILQDRAENSHLAELLWQRKPLPIQYAYAVIRGIIPAKSDLPSRLRAERGDTFEANRLAALIEGTKLNKPVEAIDAVRRMLTEPRSAKHVGKLADLLMRLADFIPLSERDGVIKEAEQHLGSDSRYSWLRAVEADLAETRYNAAETRLLSAVDENDPNWLELLAGVRVGQGRELEALDLLVKATKVFPEIGLLRKAAVIAERTGRQSTAAQIVERIIRVDPDDITWLRKLGELYSQMGEFEKAAGQYRKLRSLRPDEVAFGINEAANLAFSLKYDASLRVFDDLCTGDSPPMMAVIGRASLLKSMNRADAGFKSLLPFKAKFHDQPEFLKAYIDLGYSSKEEREAHWGFSQLQQLQSSGTIEKVLHQVGIEDLVELHRQHTESEDTLNRSILKGQFSWLLADQMLGRCPTESIRQRTRPLNWLGEEPVDWAKQVVYSTNGYMVTGESSGPWSVEAIEAPVAAVNVVTDLTSLMTMHRLGILEEAVDYFETCYYAADYLPAALREQSKLVPHQPARHQSFLDLLSSIDSGRVRIAADEDRLLYIHEHRPTSEPVKMHSFGLMDLHSGLEASKMLSDAMRSRLREISRRETGVDTDHLPIRAQDKIRIELSTMESIAREGLLNAVISTFEVYVGQQDRETLIAAISEWKAREKFRDLQVSLWKTIRDDPRFVSASVTVPAEILEKESSEQQEMVGEIDIVQSWLPFHSVFLANEKKLPLLVDDRCCQMLAHSTCRSPTAAFGTDSVLATLLASGRVTVKRASDAYLRMIGWRYRFLVLSVSVLLEIAKRSLSVAPGQDLLKVSRYVQDCMRDPGLFCGLEKTEPPIAIAHKFFIAWTNTLSNFIVTCWGDPDVPEESAIALTSWALTQCLPAVPAGLGPHGLSLAELQPGLVLSHALVRATRKPDAERLNKALISIASELGISNREYLSQVAEMADALNT